MVNTDDGIKVLVESRNNSHGLDLKVIRARIEGAGPAKHINAGTYQGKACVHYRVYRPCFDAYDQAASTALVDPRIWRAAMKITSRDASIGMLKVFNLASEIVWLAPLPQDIEPAQNDAMRIDIERLADVVRSINSRIEKATETGLYLANYAATYDK